MYSAIIIYPDPNGRAAIRELLESGTRTECLGFESHAAASGWLDQNPTPVHFVFDLWELGRRNDDFIKKLRARPHGAETLYFPIASREDFGWMAAFFHTPGLVEAVFTAPLRALTFARLVKQKIAVDPLSQPCALLVEDDTEARYIVKNHLTSSGFAKVLESGNGAEALQLLEKRYREVSLIVSDWQMPLLSGIELLGELRRKPWLARLPFIMITSQSPMESIKTLKAAELGVSGYILKPFTSKTFHAQMDLILQEIKKQREAEGYAVTARVLLSLGDTVHAEQILKEGLSLFNGDASLWEAVGDAHVMGARQTKNLAPAAEAYEKTLRLNPANVAVVMKYFEVVSSAGRPNDAVKILRAQLHRSELEDNLRTRVGKVYLENGDLESARHEFQRALASNPTNDEAKRLLEQCPPSGRALIPRKKTA